MFRRLFGLGGLLAALALTACNRIPETVTIGVAQPLSGPLASLGQDMVNGVRLAVEDINRQGLRIDGQPVRLEVLAVDDRSDPETGKTVARQLVDAGVVAVVGHLNSGVTIAAAPVYAEKHVPQLAISTKPEYTRLGLPTTLRLVANDALQAKAMGAYAVRSLNGQSFAVIDDSTPYGKGLADAAADEIRRAGKTVAVRQSLDDRTTDFQALVPELQRADVDAIVTTLADFQVLALVDQLARAGLRKVRILGSDTIKTDKLVKAALPLKVYATSPIIEPREFLQGQAFLDRYRAAYGTDPVYGSHYAYDAVWVLKAAMERSRTVDPKKLTAELKRIDALAPVTHGVRFNEQGEQHYGVVSVYEARPGIWEALTRSDQW
ncbi:branched-chain amino acid ABC transporter substrate-binding protein [Caldimonas thermodepolymerans]|jgi:ABC-type branched-chain amino acid transport systems, periplasmic component|uniref:Amino acid/amide ABC transporter substrate-binding protein (HAAT family) n=1 Tax=Caldimonas thermodepolymerans TaxID=215580 RepID=A0AA46HWT2_9BURK|nr:branched-chain amino acid ABC transporter substrate-binding protein [Caldimonas thermodepolymerans]TCP08603.1 amino acid/amide ABC transporter substrate-binding protein (HAAT family) [Caldimonas thermodepolymerans]UZG43264.1 branched-chain amino acid ABC transporter substrate-binding protein [Caldimonas thermodepolymerans]UZG46931.1 branched-chain amino acid ABC transporter substrate-binding protein [Caldimonas thermodepolymerans]